jgi:glycolate oxidase
MCLDGTIPVSSLPYVLKRIGEMSAEFGLGVGNVFHAGDGNMHPLILYDANKPGDLEICEAFGAEVLKLCVEVGGCLTGEHGVGIEKRDLMLTQFAPADLEVQMAVKDVFDPKWLLNPAKVFPLSVSEPRRSGGIAAARRPPAGGRPLCAIGSRTMDDAPRTPRRYFTQEKGSGRAC